MKTKIKFIALFLVIIVTVLIYFFVPNPMTKKQIEKDVRQHLYEEQGTTDEDILSLEVVFSPYKYSGKDRYGAIVYFKDEPKQDYGYKWNKEGKVIPAYIVDGKHNPEHLKK